MSPVTSDGYYELERFSFEEGPTPDPVTHTGTKPGFSATEKAEDEDAALDKRLRSAKPKGFVETYFVKIWGHSERRMKHHLKAWRLVVASGAVTGMLVLTINLVMVVVTAIHYNPADSTATIYTGSCTVSANTVTGIHLSINVLSTILLAASKLLHATPRRPYQRGDRPSTQNWHMAQYWNY